MARIVFTGKGKDHLGNFVDRDTLTQMAVARGHQVTERVDRWTDYLFSSRTDTTKAREAAARGVTVKNYTQFFEMMGCPGYVSTTVEQRRRPDFGAEDGERTPARFVGTAMPSSASVGDIWQPGGEGPMWVYAKLGDRRYDWVRSTDGTDDDEWEFDDTPMPRAPKIWPSGTVPPEKELFEGDIWRFQQDFIFGQGQGSIDFLWTDGAWGIYQGEVLAERFIKFYHRHGRPPRESASAAYLFNTLRLRFKDVVERWQQEEDRLIAEETRLELEKKERERIAREEAERIARERAPRFNAINPQRSFDL